MTTEGMAMIIAGIAVAFFSAATVLYFRLGAITHGLQAVKETLDMLLRKWDILRCGAHETRLAELAIKAENTDGRVIRLENRADISDRHGVDSDTRTSKVEERVGKVEERVDSVEQSNRSGRGNE